MNWRHAIGEVLLIVIGISIALGANSWYEARQAHSNEISSLEQIREALTADLETIELRIDDIRGFEDHLEALYDHLDARLPYDEALIPYFGSANGFRAITIRSAPFEALKAGGLELISDESLRLQLISLYQGELPLVEVNLDIDRNYIRASILPYFLNNFRRSREDQWAPKDYEKVVDEYYLANVATYRAFTLRRFTIPSMERARVSMRQIVTAIDEELGTQ